MMHSPQFILSSSSTNRFPSTTHHHRHPNIHLNQSPSRRSIITSARNTRFFPSHPSRRTLIRLARFAAYNLHHVLPQPFNSVIQELSGGSGGGGWWKGFGWGGFDGGGGRRRRGNRKSRLWLVGFVGVCLLGFWWMNLGVRLELRNADVVLGAMCLSMFFALVKNGCVGEWVLGFLSGGFAVGLLVDKKDEVHKFVKGLGMGLVSRRQQLRRRRGV